MFKVTNQAKDVRKFRDRNLGKDVLVGPGKSVLTNRPPEEGSIFKVEHLEEKEEKSKKIREDD